MPATLLDHYRLMARYNRRLNERKRPVIPS